MELEATKAQLEQRIKDLLRGQLNPDDEQTTRDLLPFAPHKSHL